MPSVDTASNYPENSHMAICGSHLAIHFTLPYTDFLPTSVPFNFRIAGETLGGYRYYLPLCFVNRLRIRIRVGSALN